MFPSKAPEKAGGKECVLPVVDYIATGMTVMHSSKH